MTFADEMDLNLFAATKEARLELARAADVLPYVIFHDKTLRELAIQAEVRPR